MLQPDSPNIGLPESPPDLGWAVDGPADAPAIVLVHGTRLTRAAWRAVADELSGEFRVIAVDLPGHGARSSESFSLYGAASSIVDAIDAAGGGEALVVGHSLGGYVAMDLVARWPARVRGLVRAGASQEPIGRWSLPYRLYAWTLGSSPLRLLDSLNTAFIRMRYDAHIAEPIVAAGDSSRAGMEAVRAIVNEPFLPRLARYSGPVLLINGEYDLIFRLGERAFLRSVAGARRRLIPGATHLVTLDRPEAFATAVATFARGLPTRRAARTGPAEGAPQGPRGAR